MHEYRQRRANTCTKALKFEHVALALDFKG